MDLQNWSQHYHPSSDGTKFGLASFHLKKSPLRNDYEVWTGVGAEGTSIAGIILFDEP